MADRKYRVLDPNGIVLDGKKHPQDSTITSPTGHSGDARLKSYLHFRQIEEVTEAQTGEQQAAATTDAAEAATEAAKTGGGSPKKGK